MATSVETLLTRFTGDNRLSDSPLLRGNSSYGMPSPPVGHSRGSSFMVDGERSSSDDEDEDEEDEKPTHLYWKKAQAEEAPVIQDPRDEGTADAWVERNPSLIRLTGKHPFNCEPPLRDLMASGFITPVSLHYVRNHGAVPKGTWEDWTVEVSGLVKRPTHFSIAQLAEEFPARELPVTLVCAGNRRREQNMVKQTIGFNWGAAGVSTCVWRGARLRDVLKRCGIMSRRKGALNVCFEGAEDLVGGAKYGTSLKAEIAMDPSRDIIVAYMQNGERLKPDHGFPVRMIIPGFIGGRMVKWLKRIMVTTQESDSFYHYRDNRVLPSHVDAELANAQAWWYKPEYIINDLNINSVITTPSHQEIVPINSSTTERPYTIKGYAYSGGGKKVSRVEVTMDGGDTWLVCDIDRPEKPNKFGKYWCWCFWSLQVEVLHLLAAKQIAVRAWDETLNTQPENLIWNLMGMMNNCWFRVKMSVCKHHMGEIGLVFEHPTVPGNQTGGWMARPKNLLETTPISTVKKTVSAPLPNSNSLSSSQTQKQTQFSLSDIRKHSSPDSAWIVVHGHVYDCTSFIKDHPGGADSILINAGTDCTDEFDAIHSDRAKAILEDYRIGDLAIASTDGGSGIPLEPIEEAAATMETWTAGKSSALGPKQIIPCRLESKTSVSRDVRIFRFALPSRDQVLGLPVGKHIFLCATIDGRPCTRAYTPTSPVEDVGHFDLLVRIYFKAEHPKFPAGGLMSQHLESLPIGATVGVKGPLGHIEYKGRGCFIIGGSRRVFARRLVMLAGGTGITPMYQVVQAILRDPGDETEVYLVYANRTEGDILLREELDDWVEKRRSNVKKVWYVVESLSREQQWKYSTGFITESILRQHIPEGSDETLALACGPPPMIQFAVKPNLEKMKYDVTSSLVIF